MVREHHESTSSPSAPVVSGLRRIGIAVATLATIALVSAAIRAGDFVIDDTLPGYVHRPGSGSVADVRADGSHDGAAWTVVFTRSLATGDATSDIEFVPGSDHFFQVATFDDAGGADHDITEASVSFTMTVPATPGELVFSSTPAQLTSLSGEYLASGQIQITAVWPDPTRNDRRAEWTFDGTSWAQAESEEDRLAIIWDLQFDAFVSSGTCMTMCHAPLMYTAPGSKVDTWHWKATRTNPAGHADDKWWDDGEGGTASGRHSDAGTAPYRSNASGGRPDSMGEDGNGANAKFLLDVIEGLREAAAFENGIDPTWSAGDVLSGYVNRLGSGSRVDVSSSATHDGASWSVTFKRKLDTGDGIGDIVFVPGASYSYQVATFDNAGGIDHDITEANTVHMFTLPASPGAITFAATPAQLASVSGELLSSDEITITMTWPDATRDDARKQWNFDGAMWSQLADNEDRIAVIFDLQEDGFASAGTCTTMCHAPVMYAAPGTRVDAWHWKAARTAPAGHADDQYWDDGDLGIESGRRDDLGTSVTKDNANDGGVPTYMSTAGPGVSAPYLLEQPAAAGFARAVPYVLVPELLVKTATLKVNFKKDDADSLVLSGTFDRLEPPTLGEGVTGTFEVGEFSDGFTMGKKSASLKDPNIKVKLSTKSGKWSVKIKKSALADALGIVDETILEPGIDLDLEWALTLDNGWGLSGTSTLIFRSKEGKKGAGKLEPAG